MEILSYGHACTDCTMLLANGETPPKMTEEETNEYLARVDDQGKTSDGRDIYVGLGGEHEDDCPNMIRGACIIGPADIGTEDDHDDHDHERGVWVGDTDCYCERIDFSWSACDVCGSRLGGERHAVYFYTVENARDDQTEDN